MQTSCPSRTPISSATRVATDMAATRRGCVHTTQRPPVVHPASWRYCGSSAARHDKTVLATRFHSNETGPYAWIFRSQSRQRPPKSGGFPEQTKSETCARKWATTAAVGPVANPNAGCKSQPTPLTRELLCQVARTWLSFGGVNLPCFAPYSVGFTTAVSQNSTNCNNGTTSIFDKSCNWSLHAQNHQNPSTTARHTRPHTHTYTHTNGPHRIKSAVSALVILL
jgi:hypothetical protein